MLRRDLDFEIPLTHEQWEVLGQGANFEPDYGVLRWEPTEPDVIRVSIREADAPEGWFDLTPKWDNIPPEDREVARFVYNDGRPFARVDPPRQPAPPAITAEQEQEMQRHLERWVRHKWHQLLADSGVAYDRPGHVPPDEPNPPHR